MLISCDRCETTYTLDDALIPAAGAQVQCTRCGNVFTAQRPQTGARAALAPTPPPSRPRPAAPAAAAGNKTMIFGGDAPKPPPSAPRNPPSGQVGAKTMVFGGPAASPGAAGPVPSASSAPAARTMIFGGTSSEDATGPIAPATAAAARTMIFGGAPVGGPAPAPAPAAAPVPAAAPAPAPPNRTMIFGGSGAPPPPRVEPAAAPAAPVGSRTMMFGGPAVKTHDTEKFSVQQATAAAPPPAPPAAAPNKTMIFGGAPPIAPPPARPSSPPPPAAAAAPPNKTMIFGGAPPVAPAPVRPAPPPAAAPANRTMIFGGAPAGGLPPEPKSKPRAAGAQTMMFGTAPQLEKPAPAEPSITSRTLQFGPPGEAGVADADGHVIFGADEARDRPGALTEGTVRVDQAALERMRREHDAHTAATPDAGSDAVEPPPPREKTQQFAMSDEGPRHDGTDPEGSPVVQRAPEGPERPRKTQLFAMAPAQDDGPALDLPAHELAPEQPAPARSPERPKPGPPVPSRPRRVAAVDKDHRSAPTAPDLQPAIAESSASVQVDASIVDTLDPNVSGPELPFADAAPELLSQTLPSRSDPAFVNEAQGAGLELPPELEPPPSLLGPAPTAPSPADEAAALKAQLSRKNRVVALVIAALALVLALALAWAVVGRTLYGKLTGAAVPIEALQTTEKVVAQLKGDDAGQRGAAVVRLRELIARHPRMLEAHAALVTALSLELDEAQDRARRMSQSIAGYETRTRRLEEKKPPNWEHDRDLLALEVKKLRPLSAPLVEAAKAADRELAAALGDLSAVLAAESSPPQNAALAVHRANALFYAAHGDPRAIEAVQAWSRAGGVAEHDAWPELAGPMLELNRQPQNPAALNQSLETLKRLTGRDIDLIRSFVLLARARLDLGDLDAADEAVEKVLALRSQHAFAADLKRRISEARLEQKSLKAPEPPAPPGEPAPAPGAPAAPGAPGATGDPAGSP